MGTISRCTRTTTQTASSAPGLPDRASRHGVQSRLLVCFASRCKRCTSTKGDTPRDKRHLPARTIRGHTNDNTTRNPTHTDTHKHVRSTRASTHTNTRTNTRTNKRTHAHTFCVLRGRGFGWLWLLTPLCFRFLVWW